MKVPTSLCATPGLPEAWGPICQAGPGVWGVPASPLIVHALPQQPQLCGHAAGLHRGRDGSEMDAAPRWRAARDGRAQVGGPQALGGDRSPSGQPRIPLPGVPSPCTAAAQQNPSAFLCCFIKPRPNFSQRVLTSNADGKVASSVELCVLLGGLCPEPTVLSWLTSISVGFQRLTGPLTLRVYEPISGLQPCGLLVPREAAVCWGAQASIRARSSRGKTCLLGPVNSGAFSPWPASEPQTKPPWTGGRWKERGNQMAVERDARWRSHQSKGTEWQCGGGAALFYPQGSPKGKAAALSPFPQ